MLSALKPIIRGQLWKRLPQTNIRCYSQLLEKISDEKLKDRPAVIDIHGRDLTVEKVWSYGEIYQKSRQLATYVSSKLHNLDSISSIATYCKPGSSYVISMLATWMLGKRFVPLSHSHSQHEIDYVLSDSESALVFHSAKDNDANMSKVLHELRIPYFDVTSSQIDNIVATTKLIGELNDTYSAQLTSDALVLYTSGTTGRPKGALHTHNSIEHMMKGLTQLWEYSQDDHILHFLPLHHLHGVLNKLMCMLWSGGLIEFLPSAQPDVIWKRLSSVQSLSAAQREEYLNTYSTHGRSTCPLQPTLFMAVPTIYARLLASVTETKAAAINHSHKHHHEATQKLHMISHSALALAKMRLHVSGSAALPDVVMESWRDFSGHILLERYGMTELGMALSNPYKAFLGTHKHDDIQSFRLKGFVGYPLPFVECRLVDDHEKEIMDCDVPGELRVRGPCVFTRYLNKEQATKETFDSDGWFKTGDIALRNQEGSYKMLGRSSVDIIKSGGYKLSSLEIEREILSHPAIAECAVVGQPDVTHGEIVTAIIVTREIHGNSDNKNKEILTQENAATLLREYLNDKLAKYKQPRKVHIVETIPRNHMGKVNKKTLLKELNIQ